MVPNRAKYHKLFTTKYSKKIREKNKDLKFSRIFKDFYADSLKVLKVLPATVTGYQLILARKRK